MDYLLGHIERFALCLCVMKEASINFAEHGIVRLFQPLKINPSSYARHREDSSHYLRLFVKSRQIEFHDGFHSNQWIWRIDRSATNERTTDLLISVSQSTDDLLFKDITMMVIVG